MTAKIKSQTNYTKTSHKTRPKGVSSHSFEKVYWPYIPILLLAFGLMGLAVRGGVLFSSIKHPSGNVLAYSTDLSPALLLKDTNQQRAAYSNGALKLNSALTTAAQNKANDMALRNYWSHNTPGGNPPWVFVTAAGYQYDKIGENLAAGFDNAQATINGWMASPEHKANLLDQAFTEVGFGFANNPNYTSDGHGGPSTIVVAFYGEPVQAASQLDSSNAVTLADSSNNLAKQTPVITTRAQLALAGLPLATDAGVVVTIGLVAVAAVWFGRHSLALRRSLTRGEAYVMSHPLFDISLLLLAAILYILSRTAGFIQ